MITKTFDANSWEYTQRIIRILHNRDVKKWFKDVVSDTSTTTGRTQLKTCFLIRDDDSALEVINKQFAFQTYIKKFDSLAGVIAEPIDWQVKVQKERPQLVITFKTNEKKPQYRSLHIPHYSGDKTPKILPYDHGKYWYKNTYKDNSKIWIYAQSENEAERVAKQFDKYVASKYKPGTVTTGEIKNRKDSTYKLTPVRADFYPQGKASKSIAWRHYF